MQGRFFGRIPCLIVLATGVLLLTAVGCSGSLELSSRWTNQGLALTGDASHWKDTTLEIRGPEVSVGVKNDSDNLYIGLITSNSATQLQMLALGCTVWFDTAGKYSKTFGIQFPVSGLLQGRRFPTQENQGEIRRLVDAAQGQLAVCGPGENEQHRLSLRNAGGVEARLAYVDGTLVYELKMPLQKNKKRPYAASADLTKPLLVGIETGDLAAALRAQQGVSGSSQGAGGRGGRSGGRSEGSSSGSGIDMPDPIKHWITVHLSGGPGAQ